MKPGPACVSFLSEDLVDKKPPSARPSLRPQDQRGGPLEKTGSGSCRSPGTSVLRPPGLPPRKPGSRSDHTPERGPEAGLWNALKRGWRSLLSEGLEHHSRVPASSVRGGPDSHCPKALGPQTSEAWEESVGMARGDVL